MTDTIAPTIPANGHFVPLWRKTVPVIRQSHFFHFRKATNPDSSIRTFCGWAIENRGRCGFTAGYKTFGKQKGQTEIFNSFVHGLIKQPGFLDYIITHVIPKKYGDLNPAVRSEIKKLLLNPDNWPSMRVKVRVSDRFNLPRIRPPHVDNKLHEPGDLRLGYSPEISSLTHENWFEYDSASNKLKPLVDPNGVPRDVELNQELPGTLSAWEAYSGVHQEPLITPKFLARCGEKRFFLSIKFNFDQLVGIAIATVTNRPQGLGLEPRLLQAQSI